MQIDSIIPYILRMETTEYAFHAQLGVNQSTDSELTQNDLLCTEQDQTTQKHVSASVSPQFSHIDVTNSVTM